MAWTLVTGGAKRLGSEICRTLASEGYSILVHYRSGKDEAEDVVEECRRLGVHAEAVQGDFSTPEKTEEFIRGATSRHPDIRNLINNVGNFFMKSALETPEAAWREIFQTNFHAPRALSQAFVPSIVKNQGNIINIGTAGIGTLKADTKFTAYTISKTALLLLTKSLARELASSNVRVNMVSPGELEISVTLPEYLSKLPMGKPGTLKDVAGALSYLLNKKSEYITGQNIEVSGAFGL